MDAAKIRAWWSHLQGLDGAMAGQSAGAVLEKAGWARSVGGAGPYLTLFARGGIGRAATDAAVANLEIHELPAARGCTYVVPASDFALALKVGQSFNAGEMNTARKLGVTEREIDKLCEAVLKGLGDTPLSPEEIRDAVGGAARSLGEEGKKKGLTTTLPVALGKLQSAGEIRRVAGNGRLDQQRYGYVRWRPNPLSKFKVSTEEAYTELARKFFTWIGPAKLSGFQWFSGLGVKAAKCAVEPLHLQPLADGEEWLLLPGQREKFEAFKIPKQPHYVLVSSLDAIAAHRRDVQSLLEPEDMQKSVPAEKARVQAGGLTDLPSHAILDRGRLVGLWEYDALPESIAWMAFVPKTDALKAAVERTEEYIRADLGDARSFSLDSPKSRTPRIQALRAAAR